ncbi:MAG: hypothetical protein J6K75_07110, partial [Erysipelotrichaceae bacterium]|nr:hypothetical protein [Erysipelotrichaceae bacterium]
MSSLLKKCFKLLAISAMLMQHFQPVAVLAERRIVIYENQVGPYYQLDVTDNEIVNTPVSEEEIDSDTLEQQETTELQEEESLKIPEETAVPEGELAVEPTAEPESTEYPLETELPIPTKEPVEQEEKLKT